MRNILLAGVVLAGLMPGAMAAGLTCHDMVGRKSKAAPSLAEIVSEMRNRYPDLWRYQQLRGVLIQGVDMQCLTDPGQSLSSAIREEAVGAENHFGIR